MNPTIKLCRSCGSNEIHEVFDLGVQKLSGTFIDKDLDKITEGPLTLAICKECCLVQLKHNYPLNEMYNEGYGYRSGLTQFMREHLEKIAKQGINLAKLSKGDYILDIGSNDGTLLSSYDDSEYHLIGIDPVAKKYLDLYPKNCNVVTDFFSASQYFEITNKKAKIITSVSMFYDLEDPTSFVDSIAKVLDENGVWIFEQSYLPAMLKRNSYDTICHEHLEYYSLESINHLINKSGLKLISATQNEVNGGSIRLVATHENSELATTNSAELSWLLEQELNHGVSSDESFERFKVEVIKSKNDLISLLKKLKAEGKKVIGYGASTKGNVILQYCGITAELLPFIGDITPFKDGKFTPGTNIPIISMNKAKELNPDYFLVLPWGFRNDVLIREMELIKNGVKFIFPLPFVEIIG